MSDFLKNLQKPGSSDWYSMASYGFPVEGMLNASPGINLGMPQGIPGLSLPELDPMPAFDAALKQQQRGWWDRATTGIKDSGIIGGTNADGSKFDGWGSPVVGLLQALNAFSMGNRQMKLYKNAADDARKQFAMNYGAQRQTLNTQMEDRQRAAVAANPHRESVESYMARNRIK